LLDVIFSPKTNAFMKTILLLVASNIFMTFCLVWTFKTNGYIPMESDPYQLGYCFF
jgi:uncharacterized protein (DUF486 family)